MSTRSRVLRTRRREHQAIRCLASTDPPQPTRQAPNPSLGGTRQPKQGSTHLEATNTCGTDKQGASVAPSRYQQLRRPQSSQHSSTKSKRVQGFLGHANQCTLLNHSSRRRYLRPQHSRRVSSRHRCPQTPTSISAHTSKQGWGREHRQRGEGVGSLWGKWSSTHTDPLTKCWVSSSRAAELALTY